jgi:hypothetical protein
MLGIEKMKTTRILLIAKKYRLAALELLKSEGYDCELHEYGLQAEFPNAAKKILSDYSIKSIIYE